MHASIEGSEAQTTAAFAAIAPKMKKMASTIVRITLDLP